MNPGMSGSSVTFPMYDPDKKYPLNAVEQKSDNGNEWGRYPSREIQVWESRCPQGKENRALILELCMLEVESH